MGPEKGWDPLEDQTRLTACVLVKQRVLPWELLQLLQPNIPLSSMSTTTTPRWHWCFPQTLPHYHDRKTYKVVKHATPCGRTAHRVWLYCMVFLKSRLIERTKWGQTLCILTLDRHWRSTILTFWMILWGTTRDRLEWGGVSDLPQPTNHQPEQIVKWSYYCTSRPSFTPHFLSLIDYVSSQFILGLRSILRWLKHWE